ncbi:putative smp-30 gluconolaconase lre-like region protein [Botrytis cinerea BcDW1]|uniref:Putative smp-30 gluconolaconase lre-like region protein n=1 Tax=Botryotinia fuckeliana (strain BcDW1) TaxID=1290391 RepID=M7TU67_BOTF1|nr:putative smp-30 gluconolaconase lre-like region protein [Botrytis cinerea BcDW1]
MSSIQTWTVTEPYVNPHCGLGEAPFYEPSTNTLRFVDIKKKRLHTINLSVGPSSLTTLQLDIPVGVTADIEGIDCTDRILVGGKSGIYVLRRSDGEMKLLKRFYDSEENDERLRSNDGAVDPKGRFWIGTMNDFWVGKPQSEGTMFRFDNDLTRHTIREGLTIPNGIGWSADQKTLYFTHTTEQTIWAYDYDALTGDVTNKRAFWKLDGEGEPDGFKFDSEGNIWQCVFGEGRVLKINPQGKVVGEIKYPTKCVTCPVFVGTELWVTSASDGGDEHAGALFKVDVGIGGVKDFKFKLAKGSAEL